ncbi:unnamed protein product (macronuclear) [Paramecium tetraurelia]|uniref:Calponin-homology (CH) domain-containing protein n=1 Tax=Paramecium tetraurelia TaxID=5888 RepID=A0DHE2_PARTE|nr:uncharacterized protein GSPATT00016846001 [Paramecium tetraurelia]CAK82459.1 unnamed protein product [Paramecium tetraurelia]|eukprot:XP_001449856.1 hypothetical protein (macronuclear) [Paramecium tetraurelia strain d4-2]
MINKDNPSQIEDELHELYTWVDSVPLSRSKTKIGKDFADGVLMAEVVHHFLPKQVELQNYSEATSYQSKLSNWNTLNTKVFQNLGLQLTQNDIEQLISAQNGAIERVLKILKPKILNYQDIETVEPQKSSATNISINNNQSTIQDLEQKIADQQDIIAILELKINKLQQLVKLKDNKIQAFSSKLQDLGFRF